MIISLALAMISVLIICITVSITYLWAFSTHNKHPGLLWLLMFSSIFITIFLNQTPSWLWLLTTVLFCVFFIIARTTKEHLFIINFFSIFIFSLIMSITSIFI